MCSPTLFLFHSRSEFGAVRIELGKAHRAARSIRAIEYRPRKRKGCPGAGRASRLPKRPAKMQVDGDSGAAGYKDFSSRSKAAQPSSHLSPHCSGQARVVELRRSGEKSKARRLFPKCGRSSPTYAASRCTQDNARREAMRGTARHGTALGILTLLLVLHGLTRLCRAPYNVVACDA